MEANRPRRRIERTESERLARALRRACAGVLKENGLAVESVSSRHGEQFEFRLRAVADPAAAAPEISIDPSLQNDRGFPAELLGRAFRLGARTYILRGIDRQRPDYPVVVEDADDGETGGLRDTPTLRAVLYATLAETRARQQLEPAN